MYKKLKNMVSKGRTNFRAAVEDKMTAFNSLIDIVSEEIDGIEYSIIQSSNADTSFLDEIRETFYDSIVKELYSVCEKGMGDLSKLNKAKWESVWGERPKGISDIEIYYRKIGERNAITLPSIESIWTDFKLFKELRNHVTHHKKEIINKELATINHSNKCKLDFIKSNITQVKELLLQTEQAVLKSI